MAGVKDTSSIRMGGHALRRVAAVLAWLVIWQVASLAVGSDLLLAGPLDTFVTLASLVVRGDCWLKVGWSFARIASGFVGAFCLALALAVLSWRSDAVETFLRPAMLAIKSTPVVCVVVILLMWFGSRHVSGVSVFLVVLPAIYFSSLEGMRALDPDRLAMLRLYQVPVLRRLGVYVWPALQPFLLASCKMVVGMAWKAGVAAELIGTPMGSIGERIYQAKILLETADVFAWTIIVVLVAYACEKGFLALLERSVQVGRTRAVQVDPVGENDPAGGEVPVPLAVTSVTKAYGDHLVLKRLSATFPLGSRTCLLGPSGMGKTTLIEVLAGLETPDRGLVERPDHLSLAWQQTCLVEALDAVGNVVLACRGALSASEAEDLLGEILPREVLSQPVSELSGGERRRVELARALAAPGQAVLLDEPFASLDEASHHACAAFVLRHLGDRILVVATHDVDDVRLLDAQTFSLA